MKLTPFINLKRNAKEAIQFYVKAENTRDFSRGMNWLILLNNYIKYIANICSNC